MRQGGIFAVTVATSLAAAWASPAFAADEGPSATPVVAVLIGGGDLQPRATPAVVRLGPADADWSDLGAAIDLPITVSRFRRGSTASSAGHDSLTCLTQAVYYEARSETLAGQQGVAQVVMNRTHSPIYPSDVCGVVYERSRYGTCQFTFACDGSMNRLIEPAAWDKAQQVASQALSGFVYAPLKEATHYHAGWMTPYWSSSQARIGQVGTQIFYH